jgi:hypothetical protein
MADKSRVERIQVSEPGNELLSASGRLEQAQVTRPLFPV